MSGARSTTLKLPCAALELPRGGREEGERHGGSALALGAAHHGRKPLLLLEHLRHLDRETDEVVVVRADHLLLLARELLRLISLNFLFLARLITGEKRRCSGGDSVKIHAFAFAFAFATGA